MTLLDRIRADALAARKAKDPKAGVLVTLIGEADTKMKAMKAPRPLTDGEIVDIVRKFLKNLDDTLSVIGSGDQHEAKAKAEVAALTVYLPTQMSDDDLRAFVQDRVAAGDALGAIMARLKVEKAGQYDGKRASALAKEALGL